MKTIITLIGIIMVLGISTSLHAQQSLLLQKLPELNASELKTIEGKLQAGIIREAATRSPCQFNALIFWGNNNINKKNAARYMAQKVNAIIYRVDLSIAISNSIQQTEKNLHTIFEETKNKNCVLFFDEGEALFGKRTGISNSYDRYANEETNYFISELEKHRSSIIISIKASNNINPIIFDKFIRFSIN